MPRLCSSVSQVQKLFKKKNFALKKNTLTISFLFKEKEVIKLNIISPKSSIGKVCSLGL